MSTPLLPPPTTAITPRRLHNLNRVNEIILALQSYADRAMPAPKEWVMELDDLLDETHRPVPRRTVVQFGKRQE